MSQKVVVRATRPGLIVGIAAEEIVVPDSLAGWEPEKAALSFDDKLRRLKQLRKEGLIDEEEFRRKRAEIMEQKW